MTIKLKMKNEFNGNEDSMYSNQYSHWRNIMSTSDTNFYILYNDFKDKHLKDIDGGALKLYLFYCFNSRNNTGSSWYSVESISEFFGVTEKTINNWNNKLIERGLIFRNNKDNKRNKSTYLLPFSMNYIPSYEDTDNLQLILSENFSKIYGDLYKAFHLFQWGGVRNDKTKKLIRKTQDNPFHILALVYKKNFPGFNDQYTVIEVNIEDDPTPVEYDLHKGINSEEHPIYRFNSTLNHDPRIFKNSDVKIQGIVVDPIYYLDEKETYQLIKQLINVNVDITAYEEI